MCTSRTILLLALLLDVAFADARAIIVGNTPMQYDETERRVDHSPPTTPTLELVSIRRGIGVICVDSLIAQDAEGNIGSIYFRVSGATDDRTPPDAIGYRLHYIDGDMARRLKISEDVVLGGPSLYWDDGGTWYQEPFLFRVQATAVDCAGNESAPSNVVIVGDDGDTCWLQRETEEYEKRMRIYTRRLGAGDGNAETIAKEVFADASKPPAVIYDVYASTVIESMSGVHAGRVDRVALRHSPERAQRVPYDSEPTYVLIEPGRDLSASELQQLRSILLNPKSYVTDKYECEFLPGLAFSLQSASSTCLVVVSGDCDLVRARVDGRDQFGHVGPATSAMLRSYCEGLFNLPPLLVDHR